MRFPDLVTQFLRPAAAKSRPLDTAPAATKSSRAAPMIAMHNVGNPVWTPRRTSALAEEGFRKNTVAYRCVMQIATNAASIPWLLYDDAGNEIDTHPLLDLLAHPNPLQDGTSFMETVHANLDVLDGKPFAAFTVTVTNNAASAATIAGFALLLQATAGNAVDSAVDGSGTIAVGGTAQALFGGAVPGNGFLLANPDPGNDLWLCLFGTAVANGQGSLRVAPGGYFASESGMKPAQGVSVVGAATGQKFTAARW